MDFFDNNILSDNNILPNMSSNNDIPFLNSSLLDEIRDMNSTNRESARTEPLPSAQDPGVPCFLKGSKILSTRGEMPVENLKGTEILLNHLGKKIRILNICSFITKKSNKTHPYIIPKNTKINNYMCNHDLYLSPDHAILCNYKEFVPMNRTTFSSVKDIDSINYKYYHITTENYFTDVIMSNGIPCESYGGLLRKQLNKQLLHFMYKSVTDCNQYRKILSNDQFVELINKYKRHKNNIILTKI